MLSKPNPKKLKIPIIFLLPTLMNKKKIRLIKLNQQKMSRYVLRLALMPNIPLKPLLWASTMS